VIVMGDRFASWCHLVVCPLLAAVFCVVSSWEIATLLMVLAVWVRPDVVKL